MFGGLLWSFVEFGGPLHTDTIQHHRSGIHGKIVFSLNDLQSMSLRDLDLMAALLPLNKDDLQLRKESFFC